jgi:hypothetical protein
MSGTDGSIGTQAQGTQAIVARVKAILLSPGSEWNVIDTEPATVGQLYRGYIIPLSAIPPIATFIHQAIFGISVPFLGTYHVPMGTALTSAVVQYVLGLAGVYVLALIIDALAPTFGGAKNQIQALKVVAYSSTASWVAGIFALIPGLGILRIVGLYSLYLMFLGIPLLMKSPREKAMGYTVVAIICAIVVFVVVGGVAGALITTTPTIPPVPSLN